MKKTIGSIIGLLFLMGVWGSVNLFSGRVDSTLAQDLRGREHVVFLHSTDHPEDATQLENKSGPAEIREASENIAQEVQALNEQWLDANAESGWIHIVTQWKEDYDEIGILPDGNTLEKEYSMDEWYLLNEERRVVKGIFIRRDLNGKVSQVSVLRDNAWYNLTYNDVIPVPEEALPVEFVWDFGFPGEATRLVDSLVKEETTLDGQTVVLYTVTEEFSSPMNFSEYDEPITAIKTRAYYEPDSGKLLSSEQIMIMSGGRERIRTSVKLISWTMEKQPPMEVLDYLNATYKETFRSSAETTSFAEQEMAP